MLEHAIEIDPTSDDALLNLGWIHFELKHLKQAEKVYLRALAVRETAEVYNRLALLELQAQFITN